jgi:pimeloyl-ACP methyl ester carboxylesterase
VQESSSRLVLLGFLVLAASVVAAVGVGCIYQYLAEAADLKRYPSPGRLVDVGGRKLHLLCAGASLGPTVVIEAGSGDDSTMWEDMVRRVSGFARVCAYDRAGLGWSDPPPGPLTIDDRAAGHSYGGYIVRRFAAAYPESARGVVLIDAPDEGFSFAPDGIEDIERIGTRERRRGWLALVGLARVGNALFPVRFDPVQGVPSDIRGLMTGLALRTARHFTCADEMASYLKVPRAWQVVHGFGVLGDLPLAVISRAPRDPDTGAATMPEWQAGQERLTQLSTRSRHSTAERSGHVIQFSEPKVITDAIRSVLAEATKRGPD